MLRDFAIDDFEDVAGREAQPPARRRDAVIDGAMHTLVDEARRAKVALGEAGLDADFQAGERVDAMREEGDGRVLGGDACGGRRGGADLMVDVIVGEQRRERLHVPGDPCGGEAFGNGGHGVVGMRIAGGESRPSAEAGDDEASAVHNDSPPAAHTTIDSTNG